MLQTRDNNIQNRPYAERWAQARRDAVRAASVCYLPLEERHPTSVGAWLNDRLDDIFHAETSAEYCANREISAKPHFYNVQPFTETQRQDILEDAQASAARRAREGQRRDRTRN